jgi:Skp family chaperone for outer membrane proteins
MLRFSLILSLAFAALCAGVPIHAADGSNPSMATVNMKLIFEAHPKTKEAEAQINAERNRLNKVIEEAEAKVQRVRAEIAELDADLAGGKLGNTAQEQTTTIRKEKAAQVQIMEAQVQAAREQSMKDLQKASLRMRDAILDAINSSIAKTPQLDGAGLILDKSGSSMNALPFVLYSSDSLDLSGAVQRRIAGMGARDEINGAAGNGLAVVVVDVKRVFESYSKTREAQERIDQARGTLAKEFEQRLAVATAATETIRKLEEQLADPALSEADRKARTQERSAKALELETMERENAEFRQIREKQMQEQYVRMRDGIADDINVAIAKA